MYQIARRRLREMSSIPAPIAITTGIVGSGSTFDTSVIPPDPVRSASATSESGVTSPSNSGAVSEPSSVNV